MIFPSEMLDNPDRMQNAEIPTDEAFYSKLCSCFFPETKYADNIKLLKSGLNKEKSFIKLKLRKPHPSKIETYHYFQQKENQEKIKSFKDFLRWYNPKDVVPFLEVRQKMIAFWTTKMSICSKLGCFLTNRANNCSHKQADANFYPFTEENKDLSNKN